jgi:Spy/CpxP family protein refolding chaperone
MKTKSLLTRSILCLSLSVTGTLAASCGQLEQLAQTGENSESFFSDEDTANLIDSALTAASGSSEPSLKRFPLDSSETEDSIGHGERRGRGLGQGKRGGRRHGHAGPAMQVPDDIKALMTQADAKRDSILGINRTQVEEIISAMKTDLEALKNVSATREEFEAQAKVIVEKYSAELRIVLPAFESLTQEQKDQVKAIHDLQRGMLIACIARGADPASESCTVAKTALQTNISAQ